MAKGFTPDPFDDPHVRRTPERLIDNLKRLIGLHGLTLKETAALLSISESAMTKWMGGSRFPSFKFALAVSAFFDVPLNRMAEADFSDLLEQELSDAERFKAVEAKIQKMKSGLRAVR